MKVILHRGGNYVSGGTDRRFEPSPKPQDVPAPFGEMMLGRGPEFAENAPAEKRPAPTPLADDTARVGGGSR